MHLGLVGFKLEDSCLQFDKFSMAIIIMQGVMRDFPDITIAFGESDEYSFVLHKDTTLYGGYE